MLKVVILCFILAAFAIGKECYTCEGNCDYTPIEGCAPTVDCYTIFDGSNRVVRKGCAKSCDDVNPNDQRCETCSDDRCNNGVSAPGIGRGAAITPAPRFDDGIGHGARPSQSGSTAVVGATILAVIARLV